MIPCHNSRLFTSTPGGGNGDRRNPTDEVIDSALRYRVQAPFVDSLMSDLGIDGGKLTQMGGLVREARDMQSIARSAEGGGARGAAVEAPSGGEPTGDSEAKPEGEAGGGESEPAPTPPRRGRARRRKT